MRKFFLFVVFFFLGATTILFSQNKEYPKIVKNGMEFYEYTVRQSEGLWTISQRFGVSQAEIHKHNPEIKASNGLKVGQRLIIPIKKNVSEHETIKKEETSFRVHIVQRKQTLYAISKIYKVNIADLISINNLQGSEIKEGQKLLIPQKRVLSENKDIVDPIVNTITFIEHEVKRKETLFSISRLYGVDINDITQYNTIKESLPKGMILKIPQKKEVKKISADTLVLENKKDSLLEKKDSSPAFRIGVLLPFRLSEKKSNDRFLDFYKGCLLALDNAKEKGISCEVFTYDTESSKTTILEILEEESLTQVDLIIGPAYAEIIPLVADFAEKNRIYTVIPFSSNVEGIDQNPYLIQVNPSYTMQIDLVVADLVRKNRSKLFVIGNILTDEKDRASLFAEKLEKELVKNHVPYESIDIEEANVDSVLDLTTGAPTLLLLASENKDKVAPFVKMLSSRRPKNIEVIGFEKWGIELFLSTALPIQYFSLFLDQKNLATEAYNAQFLNQFGAPVSNEIPRYDMLGFDITQYMLQMLLINRENPTEAFGSVDVDYIQSEFKFKPIENGGWVNQNFYIHNNVR